jgi:hypothetical protein
MTGRRGRTLESTVLLLGRLADRARVGGACAADLQDDRFIRASV